jgi:hypothetical protein
MSTPVQTRIVFQWAATIFVHNWPVILWLTLSFAAGIWAYRRPSRIALSFLYGFAGMAFLFEYLKHLVAYLSEPVDFLLIGGLWPLNGAGHVLVEQVIPGTVFIASLALLLRGGFAWWYGREEAAEEPIRPAVAEFPSPSTAKRTKAWVWFVAAVGIGGVALWFWRREV